ncbi:MAG TPA: hypothetical protein VHX59_02770 [Mycobacteriales bacterium]|jgi:hypothetical protein|nr:hypothetical protein [Mycobacteriales bacterium]
MSEPDLTAIEEHLIQAAWRLAHLPDDDALPRLRDIIQCCSLPEARLVCGAAAAHHRRLADELRHTFGNTHDTVITRLNLLPATLPRDRPRWTWTASVGGAGRPARD